MLRGDLEENVGLGRRGVWGPGKQRQREAGPPWGTGSALRGGQLQILQTLKFQRGKTRPPHKAPSTAPQPPAQVTHLPFLAQRGGTPGGAWSLRTAGNGPSSAKESETSVLLLSPSVMRVYSSGKWTWPNPHGVSSNDRLRYLASAQSSWSPSVSPKRRLLQEVSSGPS